MQKHRLKFDPALVVSSDLTRDGTEKAMVELLSLKRRPTAIVAFNDYVALDAVQFARHKKIKINKDLTFVSFANLPLSHYTAFPPAASVEQFPYQQGQKAMEILLELLGRSKQDAGSAGYYKVIVESQLAVPGGK
jgi:LacI family transcriptional regulator